MINVIFSSETSFRVSSFLYYTIVLFFICCTIDWFSEWPEQALISVANTFISEMPEVDPEKTNFDGLVRRTSVFLSEMIWGRLLSTYSS